MNLSVGHQYAVNATNSMQYAATKVIGINATIVLAVTLTEVDQTCVCVTSLQQTASNRLAVSTILFGSNLNRTKMELFT
jgi:hypothetical protein